MDMKKLSFLISAALVFAIIAGCEQSERTSNAPYPTAKPATAELPKGDVATSAKPEAGNDAYRLVPMSFQLSQEQVKAMFGNNYLVATSRESGGELWHYDIQPKPEYKPVNNAVYDAVGLKSGTIKGQVWLTWGLDGKLISITSYYLKNGEVIESMINESELKRVYSDKMKLGDNVPGNDVRNPMSLQISKEQIKGMFGNNYTEVIDAMTGDWKVWRFDIQPKIGYNTDYDVYKNGNPDEPGLKSQAIKGQVFVTWDPDGKLISITGFYLKNGSLEAYNLNEYVLIQMYGKSTVAKQPTAEPVVIGTSSSCEIAPKQLTLSGKTYYLSDNTKAEEGPIKLAYIKCEKGTFTIGESDDAFVLFSAGATNDIYLSGGCNEKGLHQFYSLEKVTPSPAN